MTEKNKELRGRLQEIETLILNSLRVQPSEDDECEVHLSLTLARIAEMSHEFLGASCVEAYDIVWDTKGNDVAELGLPSSVMMSIGKLDPDNLGKQIADMLSCRSGWPVKKLNYRRI